VPGRPVPALCRKKTAYRREGEHWVSSVGKEVSIAQSKGEEKLEQGVNKLGGRPRADKRKQKEAEKEVGRKETNRQALNRESLSLPCRT